MRGFGLDITESETPSLQIPKRPPRLRRRTVLRPGAYARDLREGVRTRVEAKNLENISKESKHENWIENISRIPKTRVHLCFFYLWETTFKITTIFINTIGESGNITNVIINITMNIVIIIINIMVLVFFVIIIITSITVIIKLLNYNVSENFKDITDHENFWYLELYSRSLRIFQKVCIFLFLSETWKIKSQKFCVSVVKRYKHL